MMNENKGNDISIDKPRRRIAAKLRSNYALPTERIRPERQMEILRAFVALSERGNKVVYATDVEGPTGVHYSNVRKCLPFFIEAGLLIKEKEGWKPAPELISFREKQEWDPSEAGLALYSLLVDTWFIRALSSTLSVRNGRLTRNGAIEAVARAAGCERSDTRGASLVIDILELLHVLTVTEGDQVELLKMEKGITPSQEDISSQRVTTNKSFMGEARTVSGYAMPISFHIELKLDSTLDSGKLKDLLSLIKQELGWCLGTPE